MNDEIRKLIDDIKKEWDTLKNAKNSWFPDSVSRFSIATPFFYSVIDDLMELMNKYTMPGLAKKSVVMEAVTELYDYIIGPIMPMYLRVPPISSWIRTLVLDVLISNFINFVVTKVRSIVPKTV